MNSAMVFSIALVLATAVGVLRNRWLRRAAVSKSIGRPGPTPDQPATREQWPLRPAA